MDDEKVKELIEKVTTLTADLEQEKANIAEVTKQYESMKAENEVAKEEIKNLKAMNMALALTGGRKNETIETQIHNLFKEQA